MIAMTAPVGTSADAATRPDVQEEFQQGHNAALMVLQVIEQSPDRQTRQSILADAMGELIDLDLGWDRMAPTLARLQGFAAGLMPVLMHALTQPPQPPDGAFAAHSASPLQAGEAR